MGIGFCAVLPESDVDAALAILARHGRRAWVIGHAVADPEKRVHLPRHRLIGQRQAVPPGLIACRRDVGGVYCPRNPPRIAAVNTSEPFDSARAIPRARTTMSKKTMALAAVLLACGIGAASAQGQMHRDRQVQIGTGIVQTADAAPYTQQVPDTAPLGPHIGKPKANPSAAGTVRKEPTTAVEQPIERGRFANTAARSEPTPTRTRWKR